MDPATEAKNLQYNPSQQQQQPVLDQTPLRFRSFSQNKNSENGDVEISIFDAHKYFRENNDPKFIRIQPQKRSSSSHDHQIHPRLSSASSADGRNFGSVSSRATPTASSVASWNSTAGLLVKPPGSVGVPLKKLSSDDNSNKKINERNSSVTKTWGFGRNGCCTCKKSVGVKAAIETKNVNGKPRKSDSHKGKALSSVSSSFIEIHQGKITPQMPSSPENNFPAADPPRQRRISASAGFSFPVLQNPTQASKLSPRAGTISKNIISPPEDQEDSRRDSLEVFQPVAKTVNGRHRYVPGSPIVCVASTDDDMGSDASSDLFELDSFSTQTASYPVYRRRDSLDEAPAFNGRKFAPPNGKRSLDEPRTSNVAATECYAPSEVSVDWSVTTAEGFERVSVSNLSASASSIGGAALTLQRLRNEAAGIVRGGEIGKRKANGGGLSLMSCRQEKAVSVGRSR